MTKLSLEAALARFGDAQQDPIIALIDLGTSLRPRRPDDGEEATRNLQAL